MRPAITVNHRFGSVFLHMIKRGGPSGFVSHVAKLTPEMADAIADDLRDVAARIRGERKKPIKLRLAK